MENAKKTKIFRHGTFIAEIDDSESLRLWIIANVPSNEEGDLMPHDMTLAECMAIASRRGYVFTEAGMLSIPFDRLSRFVRVLSEVDIVEVALDLGFAPVKKDGNYVCKCPHCKSDAMVALVPSKGIYRCFRCGETGNAITFVKEVRGISTDEAINYLESMYYNNK